MRFLAFLSGRCSPVAQGDNGVKYLSLRVISMVSLAPHKTQSDCFVDANVHQRLQQPIFSPCIFFRILTPPTQSKELKKENLGVDPVWWTPDDLGVKEVFTMPQTHPRYPMEFRCQMVELVRAGRTPEALAHEFEPSAQTIRTWAHQADVDEGRRKDGLTSDEREELRRLRRENRQLRQEREILAKAAAWFARETDSIPSGSTGS